MKCKWCKEDTGMADKKTGYDECRDCFELRNHIEYQPKIARNILAQITLEHLKQKENQ